jgi:hypothetical protein
MPCRAKNRAGHLAKTAFVTLGYLVVVFCYIHFCNIPPIKDRPFGRDHTVLDYIEMESVFFEDEEIILCFEINFPRQISEHQLGI